MDLRSLAIFRIGLAALLLLNLFRRTGDLTEFYTDAGVIPKESLSAFSQAGITPWSLYAVSGDAPWVIFLFIVSAIFAVALGVGWRTTAVTVCSWGLLASLGNRNPLVLTGGDAALQLMLFWGMFLPLGRIWSVDAIARDREGKSSSEAPPSGVCSIPAVALLFQVALIYPVAAIFKWREPIWRNFEAFGAAMEVEGVATPFGEMLAGVPDLAPAISAATLIFEAFGWLLAFVPWQTSRCRIAAVTIFCGFHLLGPGATMRLGYFPLVMVVAWIPFLPALFWQASHRFVLRNSSEAGGANGDRSSARILRADRAVNAVAAALLLLVLASMGLSLGWVARDSLIAEQILRPTSSILGLQQRWSLWSLPPSNRYFLITVETQDGRMLDVRRGGKDVRWNEPPRRSRNSNWWKLELGMSSPRKARLRGIYGCYWWRVWQREHASEPPPLQIQGWILEGDWAEITAGKGQRNLLWTAESEADWRLRGVTRERVYPCQDEEFLKRSSSQVD